MAKDTRSNTSRTGMPSPTWKLILEYQGSRYHGWQSQENAKSIQGILKEACRDLFRVEVDIGGAGRTDTGVHALHQVAHLRCSKWMTPAAIKDGLNARLPADISLLSVEKAHPSFHARHDAQARYYLYQISRRRTAFAKNLVWWIKEPLDLTPMQLAVQMLPGRHDFACYQDKRALADNSTSVVVECAQLRQIDDLILFRIGASHFLWRMVRRLVGVLVRLGLGQFTLDNFKASLEGQSFDVAAWTAPSSGLFLERVVYPGEAVPGELSPIIRL